MSRTDLSKFNNSFYSPGGGIVKRLLWYFVNAIIFMNPVFAFNGLKIFFLRVFGAKVGKGVILKPSVNIKYPWLLSIADFVWIGEKVWIDNLAKVTIESNVCISQGAMLLCGNHNYKKSTFDLEIGEIVLREGAWIGAKATVCPGVTCHSHSILTVGSVATHHLDAFTIYQGNPAQKVRMRTMNQA